jgi:radial spoke head protein 4/6
LLQVGGVRSNLWPGAFCAGSGTKYACVYVGWGVKAGGPFVPLPPPPVASEYDAALVESLELPPKPAPPPPEGAEEGGDE